MKFVRFSLCFLLLVLFGCSNSGDSNASPGKIPQNLVGRWVNNNNGYATLEYTFLGNGKYTFTGGFPNPGAPCPSGCKMEPLSVSEVSGAAVVQGRMITLRQKKSVTRKLDCCGSETERVSERLKEERYSWDIKTSDNEISLCMKADGESGELCYSKR